MLLFSGLQPRSDSHHARGAEDGEMWQPCASSPALTLYRRKDQTEAFDVVQALLSLTNQGIIRSSGGSRIAMPNKADPPTVIEIVTPTP
jgi:hypothetical protein